MRKIILAVIFGFLILILSQTKTAIAQSCGTAGAICADAAGPTTACCSGYTCTVENEAQSICVANSSLPAAAPTAAPGSCQYKCVDVASCTGIVPNSYGSCSSDGSRLCCYDSLLGGGNPTSKSDILTTCPNSKDQGIQTAIGCIPITSQEGLVGFFLRWAIGVGGGIAFLLILYAGFQIMTSQGDPNRLKAGQELLTAAISGLIMLIFSIFILRVIGIDILGIIPK